MSMMIQPALDVAPGAPMAGQSQANSDAQASDGTPSFFEVLSKSLLPETEVAGKKTVKVAAPARHQDKQANHDKVDPESLLLGINLPVVLPEPKLVHQMAGAATSFKDELPGLTRGVPFLPATASERALAAVNSAAHQVPGPDVPLTGLSPTAAQTKLNDALAGLEPTPAKRLAQDLPAVEALNAVLAKMTSVAGDANTTLAATPAVPAGKNLAAKLQAEPDTTFNQDPAADNRSVNALTRGDQTHGDRSLAQASLNVQSGQLSRAAENDAALSQADQVQAERQFLTTSEALVADNSTPVLPNIVGAMASASTEPAGTSSSASVALRSSYLAPEVGSQGWDKALSQHMVQMGKAGHQITELQLNPPGLGPLKVTLDLNDHQMQLTFVSNHAAVRAAVEAAVPQLRATLADSGISLGNTSVGAENQAQNQAGSSQGQGRASDHRAYPSSQLPDMAVPMAQTVTATRWSGGGLAVDTYA